MLGRLRKKRLTRQGPRASQRYVFAHGLLPALFFSNPAKFMDTLWRDKELFLQFVWKLAGDSADAHDEVAGNQLACEFVTVQDGVGVALITCPVPQIMTEPFFVAAIYRPARDADPGEELISRWITLEYSLDTEKDGSAFLCEWTAQRIHANCGPLAETTREAFLRAVSAMVGPNTDLRPLRPPDYVRRVEER